MRLAQCGAEGHRCNPQSGHHPRIYVANDYPGWAASYAKGDLATWAEKGMRIPDPTMLKDPSDLIRWELHMYMDHDASGTYRKTYQFEIERTDGPGARVSPEMGIQRVKPFVAWLKKYNVKGFIGEYSIPAGQDRPQLKILQAHSGRQPRLYDVAWNVRKSSKLHAVAGAVV